MRRHLTPAALTGLLAVVLIGPAWAAPWTYRGTLDDDGRAANGRYDLRLTLLDSQGLSLTQELTLYDVEVRDGNFAVDVDFGVDLGFAPPLQLLTEVQHEGSGFFALGDPVRFDPQAALGAVCWDTTGNAGTDSSLNFIGTTDNQPLVLRTRNAQSLRIEPSSVLFNGTPITANVIAGSSVNEVAAGVRGATISGGGTPNGDPDPAHFSEGPNLVAGDYGTVGGGLSNQAGNVFEASADSAFAVVAGGTRNLALGTTSAIGGGSGNDAVGNGATISGGLVNLATGDSSTINGGKFNEAPGTGSTVSGGNFNCAGGQFSWAGGNNAKVRRASGTPVGSTCAAAGIGGPEGDRGTFIWADSQSGDFISNGEDRYLVRATGGVVFQRKINNGREARSPRGYFDVVQGDSGIPEQSQSSTVIANFESGGDGFLTISAPDSALRGLVFRSPTSNNEAGLIYGDSSTGLFFLSGNSVRMTLAGTGQLVLPTLGSAGSTNLCRNASNQISTCSSSARYKERIEDLQPGLDAVLQLRPVAYVWKADGQADVGFIAEEVAALDERLVTRNETGEIEGVKYDRLSAVLAHAVQELAARQDRLEARLDALEAQRPR